MTLYIPIITRRKPDNKQITFILLLLLLFSFACQSERPENSDTETTAPESAIEFDRIKWSVKEGADYPYRDQMLDDIVNNDTIRDLKRDEILDLLGEPDRINEGYFYYQVSQKRIGPWPLHTKTLVIKLTDDDSVEWIKIHD